jgi:hypothetical protein
VGQVEIVDAGWCDAGEGLARQFPHDYSPFVEVQPVAGRAVLPLGHAEPEVHPIGLWHELAGSDRAAQCRVSMTLYAGRNRPWFPDGVAVHLRRVVDDHLIDDLESVGSVLEVLSAS